MDENTDIDLFADIKEAPEQNAETLDGFELTAEQLEMLGDTSVANEAFTRKEQQLGIHVPAAPESVDVGIDNPALVRKSADDFNSDSIKNLFRGELDGFNIEITDDERAAFVRAALHDEVVSFVVDIPGLNSTVTVRKAPDTYSSVVASALENWKKVDFMDLDSLTLYILAYQQLHAFYQVTHINGDLVPWYFDAAEAYSKGTVALYKFLSDPANTECIRSMHAVRWHMISDAQRVAEEKYRICCNRWHDRSFFTPAGTV